MELNPPIEGQLYARVDFSANYQNYPALIHDIEDANVITSKCDSPWGGSDGIHKVVIDVDGMDVIVLDSSTPGNKHLYIDKSMSWPVYANLLNALEMAGIIQTGYRDASLARGFTALRLPWIKKGVTDESDIDQWETT